MKRLKNLGAGVLALLLILTLLPTTAHAFFPSISWAPVFSDSGHGNGTDFTYTVGETVKQTFKCDGDSTYTEYNISLGSLPTGLTISAPYNFSNDGFIEISGIATAVTSSAQSARIWAKNSLDETQTRDITFTINKASPTISGTNTLSGAAGFISQQTVIATIANGYLGGATPNMTLTATITDGSNTATGTATATDANVSFDFPAVQLNVLTVGGPYDIMVSAFTGNANNDGFIATKIGEFTVTAPIAPAITSTNSYTCTAGTGGTFQVTATGNPSSFTYSLTGAGVPAGVSIHNTSGLITVANTVPAGTYNFTVGADNGTAPAAAQTFTLTVNTPTSSGSGSGWYVPPTTPKPPVTVPTPFPAQGTVTSKRITAYILDTLKGKTAFRLNKNEQFTLLELAANGKALLIEKDALKGYIAIKDFKATFGAQLRGTATAKKASVYTAQANGKLKRIGYYPKDTLIGINGVDGGYLISKQPNITYYLKTGEWRLAKQ